MLADRNKIFVALNLTIISIKPSNSNSTTFSVTLLNDEWDIISPLNIFFLNTSSLTQQAFISDIHSKMHPSPSTLWVVLIYVLLFVLSLRHTILPNSPAFQGCLIHIYLQDVPHFDSFILSNTFLCNFLLVFALAGNTCIHVSCYLLLVLGRYGPELYLYFHVKRSSFLLKLSFW